MQQTFINLPEPIETAIEEILSEHSALLPSSAEEIHNRYLTREKGKDNAYLDSFSDALAYLALRLPATYAQIFGALLAVQEVLPSWKPRTLLDIGTGPGTGIFAAQTVWPNLVSATGIDMNEDLLTFGKNIVESASFSTNVAWHSGDIRVGVRENESYDLVLLANVLNELQMPEAEKLVQEAFDVCSGTMVIVEPGTALGNALIQALAKKLSRAGYLIAPYLSNSFVASPTSWIHFPQRFIRPEFHRRVRQQMRESSLMASDWEEAKYCYLAVSKIPSESTAWGRCIGPVTKHKGFLEVPLLTAENIIQLKVMKRDKKQYAFAKKLKWGQIIPTKKLIFQ